MKKIKLEMKPSVNSCDVVDFIEQNSDYDWNECCDIVDNELGEIDIEVEGVIWEVNINRLKGDNTGLFNFVYGLI